ncbi:MAG: succinate dehydrogenase, cytochrome b556 subunit [Woeseiaceae bacterium]|jgi:succinate dehydrogenase / fumarate reductase cytochrome b subunit|nr:succinate dehydrogenase, cytochrome b556 subunit [Woeseiaceae bacterium]
MSNNGRPLSPHLSIYRWPITMTTSILHRVTGIALSIGSIVLAAWLFGVAMGAESYAIFLSYMDSILGRVLLIGWSFAFFFHLSNGVRHLVWDSGRGFEKSTANASAWFVLILAVILTALFWWIRL